MSHPLTCPADPKQKCDFGGEEQREMLCVRAEAKKIVACAIHLSTKAKPRLAEARVAKQVLAHDYSGYKQFLGGDLNDEPRSAVAGQFYHRDYGLNAEGALKEAGSPCHNDIKPLLQALPCRNGEKTHDDLGPIEESPIKGRKIDFLFVSPEVKVISVNATTAAHSDHDPLWADVSF